MFAWREAWWKSSTIALLVSFAIAAVSGCKGETEAPTVPTVTVAHPTSKAVTDYLEFTGNTAATDSVTLVARVEGYLQKIHFVDGSVVRKGQLLFTIQQSQYEAQLQQAEAQVEAEKAALFHAKTEFARYSNLLREDAATQTEVDQWRYKRDSSAAELLSAQAQVELARLNVSYTTVRSPFDGRIGRHLVDPGNLVGTPGQQTPLAEVNQIDPLYVYFTINERDLLKIIAENKGKRRNEVTEEKIPVFFALSNETGYPHEGRLDFASISVSPTTGTLQLLGIFPNHDLIILPGLFVRVRVPVAEQSNSLLVPGDAVSFDQQGEYVLVVNNKNTVERRGVKTGPQVGELLVIREGLQPNDNVIVEGLLQSIPGRVVNPQPAKSSHAATTTRSSSS